MKGWHGQENYPNVSTERGKYNLQATGNLCLTKEGKISSFQGMARGNMRYVYINLPLDTIQIFNDTYQRSYLDTLRII